MNKECFLFHPTRPGGVLHRIVLNSRMVWGRARPPLGWSTSESRQQPHRRPQPALSQLYSIKPNPRSNLWSRESSIVGGLKSSQPACRCGRRQKRDQKGLGRLLMRRAHTSLCASLTGGVPPILRLAADSRYPTTTRRCSGTPGRAVRRQHHVGERLPARETVSASACSMKPRRQCPRSRTQMPQGQWQSTAALSRPTPSRRERRRHGHRPLGSPSFLPCC